MIKRIIQLKVYLILLISCSISAQHTSLKNEFDICQTSTLDIGIEWIQEMYENPYNIEKIKSLYEAYYQTNDFIKNEHTQYFKRLCKTHSQTNYKLGSNISKEELLKDQKKYLKKYKSAQKKSNDHWTTLGPFDIDIDAIATGSTPGSAHVFHIDYCRGLPQHLLAGTASAGLWKSSNDGLTWEIISAELPVNTVKAASYEPNNPSHIYFSSNNQFYKTINGGYDWQEVGGAGLESIFYNAYEILVNPDNSEIIWFATDKGLFRSVDKAENFTQIVDGNILDIEFHPTNSNIIYLIKQISNKTEFWRSTDAGITFNLQINGYPQAISSEDQKRTAISVSIAEPDAVWALAVGKVNGGDGLVGVYKSENQGTDWNRKCCGDSDGGVASSSNKNIMEWGCDGTKNGGQYYYDLALGVSPTNPNQLLTGGINLWVSENSGETMTCYSEYIYQRNPSKYVHADIHAIKYINNKVWIASDGGIFVSTDNLQTFQKRMYGIVGTDFRGFDLGFNNKEIMIGGTYHNGTFLKVENTFINDWVSTRSGDNERSYVNRGMNDIVYDHTGMRELNRDRNKTPHNVTLTHKPNSSFTLGESSELIVDPFHYNTLYVGQNASLYKSSNNGISFDLVKNFGQGKVTAIEVSSTLPNLIYVVHYPSFSANKKIMRSTNGGVTFVDVTPETSLFGDEDLWVAFDITIGSHNPYEIWLARIPQTTSALNLDGKMIYFSSNGGDSWTNITTPNLDGEFPTNILHQQGSDGGVYLGTRRTVFFKSHASPDWQTLSNSLPALCFSTKLVPHYPSKKLVNATQRGLYEIDFQFDSTPLAVPSVDKKSTECLRDTFYFIDSSPITDSSTRLWSFPGADIPSSTLKNPKVTYSTPGQFNISLQVTTPQGTKTYAENQFLTVTDGCKIDSVIGKSLSTGNAAFAQIPALKKSFSELTISAWVKRQGVIYESAGIVLHRDGPYGTGLIIQSTGAIGYLWNEVSSSFSSGLSVPYNKWAHIAMSVDSNGISLFVDGKESRNNFSVPEMELLENILIGADQFSASNYLNGQIDEIAIYDKALNADEIRLAMNLTKTDQVDGLIAYFQANNATGKLTDRIGHNHAYMMQQATRTDSKAPVSSGCAELHVIDLPGTYDFDCADVVMTFDESAILPMGPVSVVKMHNLPDMPMPEGTRISKNYYVFNNHGLNSSFTPPSQLIIKDFGEIDSIYTEYPEFYNMYQVPSSWEYGWGNAVSQADSVNLIDNTSLEFNNPSAFNYMGKILLTEEGFPSLSFVKINCDVSLVQNNNRLIEWDNVPNLTHYEIQKSKHGVSFETIKKVNYSREFEKKAFLSFIDQENDEGLIYYRIIGHDIQGNKWTSNIVNVKIIQGIGFQIYPNILNKSDVIHINWNNDQPLSINIFDLHGRLILSKIVNKSKETLALDLEKGNYYMECTQHQTSETHQFIIAD